MYIYTRSPDRRTQPPPESASASDPAAYWGQYLDAILTAGQRGEGGLAPEGMSGQPYGGGDNAVGSSKGGYGPGNQREAPKSFSFKDVLFGSKLALAKAFMNKNNPNAYTDAERAADLAYARDAYEAFAAKEREAQNAYGGGGGGEGGGRAGFGGEGSQGTDRNSGV